MNDQKAMWLNVPDVAITPQTMWAAGDYVVTIAALQGSKDGRTLSMTLLEVAHFEGGKVKEGWRWYNGAEMSRQLGSQ